MEPEEFLLARLAEDKRTAREAIPETVRGYGNESRRYVMRMTPDRVVRECDAKTAIVERYVAVISKMDSLSCWDETKVEFSCWAQGLYDAIMIMAAVYSDHPDYDKAWDELEDYDY